LDNAGRNRGEVLPIDGTGGARKVAAAASVLDSAQEKRPIGAHECAGYNGLARASTWMRERERERDGIRGTCIA
jgi:hypothetical protein